MKIVEELAKNRCLDKLETECDNSSEFTKREVGFCAQWSLDNLCESRYEINDVVLIILSVVFVFVWLLHCTVVTLCRHLSSSSFFLNLPDVAFIKLVNFSINRFWAYLIVVYMLILYFCFRLFLMLF